MPIPKLLAENYRIATSHDIRSWSFGRLTSRRRDGTTSRDNVQGTLYDQRIFGPVVDHKCACGRYNGDKYRNMICDRCGVKIAPTSIRAVRFGHIKFSSAAHHPLDRTAILDYFPVMPARFVESSRGADLAVRPRRYDRTAANGRRARITCPCVG